jgi:hypothetical protein
LTALKWENVIMTMPISLLLGTGLGAAHGWLARMLVGGEAFAQRWPLRLGGSPVSHTGGKSYGSNS